MAITYLDEEKPKSKITYLDEGTSENLSQENKPEPVIKSAPQQGIMERMSSLFKISPEEQVAKSQNEYAISKTLGIPLPDVIKQNLTQDPQTTGIMRDPTGTELLQSQISLYGGAALAAGAVTNPALLLKGLPGATIGYAVGKFAKPFERLLPEETSPQLKDMGKMGDEVISGLLGAGGYMASAKLLGDLMPKIGLGNYARNKVIAVRKGAMKTYEKMQDTYGKDLASLSKNPEKVDPTTAIGKMEQMIDERMPMLDSKRRTPPTNSVDSALHKAKEELYLKWANSKDGKVTVGDIVSSLKRIKDGGGKSNRNLIRMASKTQGEILSNIKDEINVPAFQEMQLRYRNGMQELEAMDKAFDIWQDNPILTAKGERFVKGGIFKSKESENITKLVQEKTGQTMKLGKVSSRVNQLMGNRILRYLVYGTIAGIALETGIKTVRGRD